MLLPLASRDGHTFTASAHLKELSATVTASSLRPPVWKHLPLMMLSDLRVHLVFHPLISGDDVALVSERRMGFIESEPFRAGRWERSPPLTLHLVDKTVGAKGEAEVSRSRSWPVANPGPKTAVS